MTNEEKINLLGKKLMLLTSQLDKYKSEIEQLNKELNLLKGDDQPVIQTEKKIAEPTLSVTPPNQEPVEEIRENPLNELTAELSRSEATKITSTPPPAPKKVFNLEEYVGGKLIHVIGTVILVIGIFIGVKFAIEKDLINELTRTLLGYLAGGIILTFSYILKKKYSVFSAVLLSGAMAVMYFTTFIAHSSYQLFPNATVPFLIMVLLTAFTVLAAHVYNYQVIALIGLLAAYAIPPLLSDGSGKVVIMFTYMSIINTGILILSVRKDWKIVNISAYVLTWLIFASWVIGAYSTTKFSVAMSFASIFFITFYFTGTAYKIFQNISMKIWDVIHLLTNSFLYFSFGYYFLNTEDLMQYQGLFCLLNATIHAAFVWLAYKRNIADKNLLFLVIALVISFITITVPVQLEGHYVTLIWFSEMVVMFLIGVKYQVNFYKYISYALMMLGACSLFHDWSNGYSSTHWSYEPNFQQPIFNKYFLVSIFASSALALLIYKRTKSLIHLEKNTLDQIANFALPILLFIAAYFSVFFEIDNYFEKRMFDTSIKTGVDLSTPVFDESLNQFNSLWKIIFTSCVAILLTILNHYKLKNKILNWVSWGFNLLVVLVFIENGTIALSSLHSQYFNSFAPESKAFQSDWMLNARYFFLPFFIAMLYCLHVNKKQNENKVLSTVNLWLTHFCILFLLSTELTHQLTINNPLEISKFQRISYRFGFTILWALYSMLLIIIGIWKKSRNTRIIAISIFGITIIKLVIDAFDMSRGYQLLVFCSLGVILILVGFLYQRFKTIIFSDDQNEKV